MNEEESRINLTQQHRRKASRAAAKAQLFRDNVLVFINKDRNVIKSIDEVRPRTGVLLAPRAYRRKEMLKAGRV